ncbi:3-phosphoserine/phosphohydroxythreonine transaminase [Holdemania massiliensis]|uniref:3-phosphoserine/phosphohydroxythreonine transaminase n=1 Tax=Holdemania massiliensis TaxID=1468449 RepID=UPI003569F1CD
MTRVLNFSAGPSQLPLTVVQKAAAQLLEYGTSGQSVMEMSHRSSTFLEIVRETERRLRSLLQIPQNYRVLFLQGGASLQFSMVPMNLLKPKGKAGIIHTGTWTKKAIEECRKFGECVVLASGEADHFHSIPKDVIVPQDLDYVYLCENNTIIGTKYKTLPECGHVPLVADCSSCILSEPMDVSRYGLIFAGAQKNMGIAGLTVVIVRDDLIEERPELPSMMSYAVQVKHESMFNTPPTFAIYMLGLVLEWIETEFQDLKALQSYNQRKAALLYDYLDSSALFKNEVKKEDRSMMNVPFMTDDPQLDAKFIAYAQAEGLVNLKGHRSVGGMRASIYNGMPMEGVEKLVEVMKRFEEAQAIC